MSFDQVGGLDRYIKALKEMVFLPLVYPELFERFHITPPRGVLFYGPPGETTYLRGSIMYTFYKHGTQYQSSGVFVSEVMVLTYHLQ